MTMPARHQSRLDAALAYASLGWHVFPCREKMPLGRAVPNGYKDATADPAIIRAWWHDYPEANIGLALEASGLVAIDADTYKPGCKFADMVAGLDLPETLMQQSARGGTHYVYSAAPGTKYPGHLFGDSTSGVEIKHRGYILLTPSTFAAGAYRWLSWREPAPAPSWLSQREKPASGDNVLLFKGADLGPRCGDDDSQERALRVLHSAPNTLGRDDWVRVCHAVKHELGKAGRDAFLAFSGRYAGSDPKEDARVWDTAKPDGTVTLATVFDLLGDGREARQASAAVPAIDHASLESSFSIRRAPVVATLPKTEFVYSDLYARGFLSLTVAAPKIGKTLLGLVEAVDIASGAGVMTGVERDPQTVIYFNAEDSLATLDKRVAAICQHYGIDLQSVYQRLVLVSGVDLKGFYLAYGPEGTPHEGAFALLKRRIEALGAAALTLDPLQDVSASPEANEVFRLLGARLRRLAVDCGISVHLVHLTRKLDRAVPRVDLDDARGGSALRGISRFSRALAPMTEDEGAMAGVENRRHYFRVTDAEATLAPPSAEINRWFFKASVLIENGEHVGVVERWDWPDAFDGISKQAAVRAQRALGDQAHPINSRSADWIGRVIGNALEINTDGRAGRARVAEIVKTWINNGALVQVVERNPRTGRDQKKARAGAALNAVPQLSQSECEQR